MGDNRLGEVGYNRKGEKMTIIEYINSHNIVVKFENGCINKNAYNNFQNGRISSQLNRIGEVKCNKWGSKMTIIEYINYGDILVQFNDDCHNNYIVKSSYGEFKKGSIKSPYDKSVYKIGYIGEGKYKTGFNYNITAQYSTWHSMMQRCYDTKFQENNLTYIGCTVCKEWLSYQNFAQWYDRNYYELDKQRMDIDKDILIKGNKIYSPETCVFVPHCINDLFVKNNINRGKLPIGVSYDKEKDRYKVTASCNSKQIFIGRWKTMQDDKTFIEYKKTKEKIIKQMADEYKNKYPQFPKKLYNAMYTYEVEITD